jgi:hypothetical protein
MGTFMDKYKDTQDQREFVRAVVEDYNNNVKEWTKKQIYSHREVHLLLAAMYSFACQKKEEEFQNHVKSLLE